jgi:hypothetical protein
MKSCLARSPRRTRAPSSLRPRVGSTPRQGAQPHGVRRLGRTKQNRVDFITDRTAARRGPPARVSAAVIVIVDRGGYGKPRERPYRLASQSIRQVSTVDLATVREALRERLTDWQGLMSRHMPKPGNCSRKSCTSGSSSNPHPGGGTALAPTGRYREASTSARHADRDPGRLPDRFQWAETLVVFASESDAIQVTIRLACPSRGVSPVLQSAAPGVPVEPASSRTRGAALVPALPPS